MSDTRTITKLLVANRGEIVRRVFRTCRELGIATVAVYSEPDAKAAFALEADEAIPLGGHSPSESYLRGDAVIAAALKTGADAVHPGYGFLSENAGFARACLDAGLLFVGPTPTAIAAMGSKIEAKALMVAAGVPMLSSIDVGADPAVVDWPSLGSSVSELGWPVLVKASAGGGGRGMRVVDEPSGLAEAVTAAMREAASAFGDATVFVEPYLPASRHVEVQIFGDSSGRVIHLYERDCSIQRRHQKIVEESPCPVLSADQRAALCASAVEAGRAIGYTNAGTVEFLLAPGGRFFFLEVNTRLQVEHPVTEMVTGLDLVRLQLHVASGGELPDQADVPPIRGHAIEARLYAEDPTAEFRPSTGTLHRFDIDSLRGLRVDSAYDRVGGEVTHHYDPMLAKVVAHGATRADAAARLAAGLAHSEIHGVTTNRDLLVRTLRHPDFAAGAADSTFLDRHGSAELGRPASADPLVRATHAAAFALSSQARRRAAATTLAAAPSGFRNVPMAPQVLEVEVDGVSTTVGYRISSASAVVEVDGQQLDALVESIATDAVRLVVDGVRRTVRVHLVDAVGYVDSPLGSSTVVERPRFVDPTDVIDAGSLRAPMPGTVVAVHVSPGDSVEAGDPLVTIEAMKMELVVRAPHAGTVTALDAAVGQAVTAGHQLGAIRTSEGS